MRLWYIFIFCNLSVTKILSQEHGLYFSVAYAPSYFFNDSRLDRYIDHSWTGSINYTYQKRKSNFVFDPGLHFQKNSYHGYFQNWRLVHVDQLCIGLNLNVRVNLRPKTALKVGLEFSRVFHSDVFISLTDRSSRDYFESDNPALRKNYKPAALQAAITLGLIFRVFKHKHQLGISWVQHASRLVDSDFKPSKQITGEEVFVLSPKARATMLRLSFGWTIPVKRKPKKVEEKTE